MEEKSYEDSRRNSIHKVYLNGRKTAVLSGVKDVLSFDAKEVYLETQQGILLIRGDELHVSRLSLEKGEVDVDGRIDSFAYSDREEPQKKAGSFLGRMFQ
ncbi:MAG: sporulation protein YabP [Butyribacter sp.]|nr:sporulation protein YabP [bacterium]MDY3853885.1 sporulation protein YabP [Butyribacter sp.]